MSEVGALRVSLSLDNADFSRSLTDVNSRLRGLRSEMNVARSGGVEFGKSLEGLRSRSDILNRTFQLQQQKVNELKRRYDESVATKGRDAVETQKLLTQYNNAAAAMNRTSQELKAVNTEIERQSNKWVQLSDKLGNASERFKAVGERMQNVGKDLSMKVTAPIMAAGTGMVLAGANFEEAMSKVQAVSGASANEMKLLEQTAKDLGASTRFSASEVASAQEMMALAGWDVNQILTAQPALLDLAAAGNLNLKQASDIVTDSMSAFALEADKAGHVSDVFAYAQANANTNVEMLGQALSYVAPAAHAANLSIEETTTYLSRFADNGIKGSRAGTVLEAMLRDLRNRAEDGTMSIGDMTISIYDAEGQMRSLTDIMADVEKATAGMNDETRNAALGQYFQTEAMRGVNIVLNDGTESLYEFTEGLENSNGAAKEMADIMSDNTKGNIKQFQSAVEGVSISFSEHLLPHVNRGIDFLTDLTRKFGELSPETQKTIIGIAGVAAAIGPTLIVSGKLVTSLGAIAGVASKASAAIAAKGGALALLTNPIGLTVAGLAAITAGGIALYNHLKKDSIPEIDLFGDSVSEATQQAVGGFLDLNEQATLALNELSWSGKSVSEEMKDTLTLNFEQMGSQIVDGLNEKKDQSIATMQELFARTTEISEEEQQALLKNVENGYSDRQAKVREGEERIKKILEIASEENRGLKDSEKNEINRIQQEMVDEGIRTLTANEREQKVILERMQQQASEITAHQAAEVVRNAVEQKEKVVTEAEQQYSDAIAEIIYLRDEAGTISKEQADTLIAEAQRQRDETVSAAEEQHNKIVAEAQAQAKEHVNHVNWETGEILSKWQVAKNNIASNWGQMRSDAKTNWTNMGNDIRQRTEEIKSNAVNKFTELRNDTKTRFQETKENMLRPIREAKETISGWIDEIKGFFSNLELKFPKIQMPPLPRFSLDGDFSLNPPRVPRLNVSWNARGAYFDRPVVFNSAYGLQGFGEAGGEIAMPAEGRHMWPFADAVAERIGTNNNDRLENLLIELIQAVREGKNIIMNDREVGRIVEPHVSEIQNRSKRVRDSFA